GARRHVHARRHGRALLARDAVLAERDGGEASEGNGAGARGRPDRAPGRAHSDADLLPGFDRAPDRAATGQAVEARARREERSARRVAEGRPRRGDRGSRPDAEPVRVHRPGRRVQGKGAGGGPAHAARGRAITRDYAGTNPVLVGILQGAVPFVADLMRGLPIDLTVDFLRASSYGAGTSSSGTVRIVADLSIDITGRHVLIVDDIIDTGLTLAALKRTLEARRPQSLRTCVLLDKTGRRETEVTLDYVGFTIPNVFVVGYGLDYDGLYRNLPHVAALDGI